MCARNAWAWFSTRIQKACKNISYKEWESDTWVVSFCLCASSMVSGTSASACWSHSGKVSRRYMFVRSRRSLYCFHLPKTSLRRSWGHLCERLWKYAWGVLYLIRTNYILVSAPLLLWRLNFLPQNALKFTFMLHLVYIVYFSALNVRCLQAFNSLKVKLFQTWSYNLFLSIFILFVSCLIKICIFKR